MASMETFGEFSGAGCFCSRPESILTRGGNPLRGEICVQGAKNSTLPLLAAAVACRGETVLHNCPELTDVHVSARILRRLGCRCTRRGKTLVVDPDGMTRCDSPHGSPTNISAAFLQPLVCQSSQAVATMANSPP